MQLTRLDSEFLRYLIDKAPGERLPTLNQIGDDMGVSVGKLREQLEVARALGLVSVRPRLGVQREKFDFAQVLLHGIFFSLAAGEATFEQLAQVRRVLELGFWDEAVAQLTPGDIARLEGLVARAWDKLRGEPIHVPTAEHRALHMTIFGRLQNPFVIGLLETYWDAYEASEMTRFTQYAYWVSVWEYHEQIVAALRAQAYAHGRQLLQEHFALLRTAPASALPPVSAGAHAA